MKIINTMFSNSLNTDMDKSSQVHFLPWVGDSYTKATKKLLVLGESHYCANLSDDKTTLTQEVIDDFISPYTAWEPYKNTYTKFTRALAGYEVPKEEVNDIWEYVIFYNYVQVAITGPRIAPTYQQFSQSEGAFWRIIDTYQPDYIIAWGKRLFRNMPSNYSNAMPLVVNLEPVRIKVYNRNGINIKVMQMTHPSAGYSWRFWHKAIEKLIEA